MLTEMKKVRLKFQNPKFLKNGKNDLEIWWTATFPQKLALIRLMVSEKTRFTDDDDDWRPRHGIRSADTVKQS